MSADQQDQLADGDTSDDLLGALANGDRNVLEAVAAMNLDTMRLTTLDPRSYWLVRLAALAAVNGPPVSYLLNLGVADRTGVTREQVYGVLSAIAPIVGTPRIVAAAGNVVRAREMASVAIEELGQPTATR
jgi:alkylhydroperoxidase/carboxymuconolactone decarboxylase family protein YurZ